MSGTRRPSGTTSTATTCTTTSTSSTGRRSEPAWWCSSTPWSTSTAWPSRSCWWASASPATTGRSRPWTAGCCPSVRCTRRLAAVGHLRRSADQPGGGSGRTRLAHPSRPVLDHRLPDTDRPDAAADPPRADHPGPSSRRTSWPRGCSPPPPRGPLALIPARGSPSAAGVVKLRGARRRSGPACRPWSDNAGTHGVGASCGLRTGPRTVHRRAWETELSDGLLRTVGQRRADLRHDRLRRPEQHQAGEPAPRPRSGAQPEHWSSGRPGSDPHRRSTAGSRPLDDLASKGVQAPPARSSGSSPNQGPSTPG